MSEAARYITALLSVPGVGRVAAHRLVEHFPSADELLACPIEQVALRLKGVGRAADIAMEVKATLSDRMAAADSGLAELAQHEIVPITVLDSEWPTGLRDLDRPDQPIILQTHGMLSPLTHVVVALYAHPTLSDTVFETAQTALRRILRAGAVPVAGAHAGFEAAVHNVCSSPDHASPSIMVLSCGLGKLEKPLRPVAAAVTRCGGLLVSSFALNHGPFAHDELERSMIQAALADVILFIEPDDGAVDRRVLEWATSKHKPVFVISDADTCPDAHHLVDETDLDWLELAISLPKGDAR